jgi:hypothetical protein
LHTLCLGYLTDNVLTERNKREEFFVAHAATLEEIVPVKFGDIRNARFSFHSASSQSIPPPGHNRLTFRFLAAQTSDLARLFTRYLPNLFADLVRIQIVGPEVPSSGSFPELSELRNEYDPQNQLHVKQWFPFRSLQELSIPLWLKHHTLEDWRKDNYTPVYFTHWLEQYAEFFGPSVEVLSGCLPPIEGLTADGLGRALHCFRKLKRIVICDLAVGGFDDAEAYVLELATSCVSLEVVDVKDTADNIESGLTLVIGREGQSKLIPRIIRRKWVGNYT